jgi:hypothetical protein
MTMNFLISCSARTVRLYFGLWTKSGLPTICQGRGGYPSKWLRSKLKQQTAVRPTRTPRG